MAQKLRLAAAGTLTSGDVQVMSATGAWYFDDTGEWPAHTAQSHKNLISYSAPLSCINLGGCVRLKAVNTSYVGQHGSYLGSVPFLKYFCGNLALAECHRRMALSTRSLVGVNAMKGETEDAETPTLQQFALTLADQFCPGGSSAGRKTCQTLVTNHILGVKPLDPSYTTLPANVPLITCTPQKCQFRIGVDDKGQRIFEGTGPSRSTTMIDELNAYVEGYRLLPK